MHENRRQVLLPRWLPALWIASAGCVNHAVLERRVTAWEEEAAALEFRGDSRGAAELRELASKARGGVGAVPVPTGRGTATAVPGRLDRQTGSMTSRAESLYRESRLDEARIALAEVLERDPAMKPALDLKARIDSEKFQPKRDKPFADMASELYEKGMRRLRRGDTREAFDLLSQARQVYRDDETIERAVLRCSQELEALGKHQTAEALFKEGRELLDSGKPLEADDRFAQAQVLEPDLPSISEFREQAAEALSRAKLQALAVSLSSARTLGRKGRYDEAEALLAALFSGDSGSPEVRSLLAELRADRERVRTEKLESSRYQDALSRVRSALGAGDAAAARKDLEEAKSLRPGSRDLEEWEKKLVRLEESGSAAVQGEADEAYRKGMVAYRQGREDEATSLFREALRLDSGHVKAAKALDRLGEKAVVP